MGFGDNLNLRCLIMKWQFFFYKCCFFFSFSAPDCVTNLSAILWQKTHGPEGEGVVSNKCLTLPDQEGAVFGPALAVLLQEFLSHLSAIASSTQLPMKPALCTVLLIVVALLTNYKDIGGSNTKVGCESTKFCHVLLCATFLPPFLHHPPLHQLSDNETSPQSSKSYYWSRQNNVASMSANGYTHFRHTTISIVRVRG